MMAWAMAHMTVICGFAWAILNEAMALNKSLASNSLLDLLRSFLKGKSGQ